jgi:hypothetical protein
MSSSLVIADQEEPLLVTPSDLSDVESTTTTSSSLTPKTPLPQSNQSSVQAIDFKKNTTRPKIRGSMANLLRRRCCIRNLQHSMAIAIQRPKTFRSDGDDDDDEDEDTALLTESSSQTATSSFDMDDSENEKLL